MHVMVFLFKYYSCQWWLAVLALTVMFVSFLQ